MVHLSNVLIETGATEFNVEIKYDEELRQWFVKFDLYDDPVIVYGANFKLALRAYVDYLTNFAEVYSNPHQTMSDMRA